MLVYVVSRGKFRRGIWKNIRFARAVEGNYQLIVSVSEIEARVTSEGLIVKNVITRRSKEDIETRKTGLIPKKWLVKSVGKVDLIC